MTDSTSLDQEILDARLTISTDGYPMSIGELTNMYRDNELRIRPEFQRFYRWDAGQKSRLIESLLLGIPLPSIFVAQTENGQWEVVDGLQRLSTILQLQGELRNESGERIEPLRLTGTKYLPSLEGKTWESPVSNESLSGAQRLDIKRAKLDIKIIKRDSSPQTKFDLFQRLNSFGTSLTSQELRSALLVAVSADFFAWLEHLSRHPSFRNVVGLSDRLIEERYDLELVSRFIVLHNWDEADLTLTALRNLPQILDDRMVELASEYPYKISDIENVFISTFDFIASYGGENVFRRWDVDRADFRGSFLNTSFEVFALGIGYNIARDNDCTRDLIEKVIEFWSMPQMRKGFATGRSTEARLMQFIPMGRNITRQDTDDQLDPIVFNVFE